jgi:hypothetical protein
VGEYLRRLRDLEDRCGQGPKALELLPLPLPLCLLELPPDPVLLRRQLRERAPPDVLAHHPAALLASPAPGVVAPPALPFLPRHGARCLPLRSRGGSEGVTQRRGIERRGRGGATPRLPAPPSSRRKRTFARGPLSPFWAKDSSPSVRTVRIGANGDSGRGRCRGRSRPVLAAPLLHSQDGARVLEGALEDILEVRKRPLGRRLVVERTPYVTSRASRCPSISRSTARPTSLRQ